MLYRTDGEEFEFKLFANVMGRGRVSFVKARDATRPGGDKGSERGGTTKPCTPAPLTPP